MAQTDLQGFPIPEPDEANDIPEDLMTLVNEIEKTVVQRYATLAARNAANPSPNDGEVCYVESENAYYVRLNGAWRIAYSDTGWLTSGIAIAAQTGWSISSYRLKREGNRVHGVVVCERTGDDIVPNAAGNFTDSIAFSMPEGWRNGSGVTQQFAIVQTGVKTAFARADANLSTGNVTVTHGIPGVTVDKSQAWFFPLDYSLS
ncbi:hypothetical protein ACFSYH_01895 [Populibacterium corticicola]|uniref:Minor tail protein n=1 Tax=Populibacterium corticicola TaxID=1812826 RepID=A0ABW5XEQ4_9MICO